MMHDPADALTVTAPPQQSAHRGTRLFHDGDLIARRFRVVRKVDEGSMGIVYEVVDEKLNERRALKCAKPGYANYLSPEARSSLRVTHPNVCRVFEIHTTDTPQGPVDFLTMEYLAGGTLSSELQTRGRLPEAEARDVAVQICAGVEAAHAQNLLHRDLKPKNVLLTPDTRGRTRAVVTDFGLAQEPSDAHASASKNVAGTPAYLAPERWHGGPATVASDIFALGIILHELMTGTLPAPGPGGARDLSPDLPKRWRAVIARCLDPDPRRRFASASSLAAALTATTTRARAAAWTAAVLTPVGFLLWQILSPTTVAARLAILPLEGVNADPQTEALIRGASYDLSTRLTRLRPRPPQLVVIPIEETDGLTVSDLGGAKDRLGASHVLRGTVTRRGDRLRVRGSIIDTATQVTLRAWEAEYDAANAGAVAAGLSGMVAAAFRLPRQTTAEQVSPVAYEAYTEGHSSLRRGPSSYADAIAAFQRAAALDPRSVVPHAGLVEAYYSAWVATSDEKWLALGREALTRAEALNADSLAVRLAAGRLNLVPGAYEQAARDYERATQLEPSSPEAWAGLARAYQEMQDHDNETVAAFMKAIALQPDYYVPLVNLGIFYNRLGNYTEAEKLFVQAAKLAPRLLSARTNLGGNYVDMGRYADAERELMRALQIDPRSRSVLNNLGAMYQYMRRDDEAVKYLERARYMGPVTHVLMLNLGDSYRRLGRTREAAAAYQRGRQLAEPILLSNPRDGATRAFVAYFALRLGDRATAERELVQALNSGVANRAVIRRAAICFEILGDRDRVLTVLESAPPDVIRELSRQPDLVPLHTDPRFVSLLSRLTRS